MLVINRVNNCLFIKQNLKIFLTNILPPPLFQIIYKKVKSGNYRHVKSNMKTVVTKAAADNNKSG